MNVEFKTPDELRAYLRGMTEQLIQNNAASMRESGSCEECIEQMAAQCRAQGEENADEVVALVKAAQEEFDAPRILN